MKKVISLQLFFPKVTLQMLELVLNTPSKRVKVKDRLVKSFQLLRRMAFLVFACFDIIFAH